MLLLCKLAIADEIDVNVTILHNAATYQMSELHEAVMDGSAGWVIQNIASLTLTNTTNTTKHVKIRVKLYADKIDPSKPLVDYTTNYSNIPIIVEPGQTITIDTNNPDYVTGGTLRSDKSEIRNKVRNAFGDNPLNYSGWVPEDRYRYEILVFDKDNNEVFEGDALGRASDSIFIPQHSKNITVLQPIDDEVVAVRPKFSWESLDVRVGAEIRYNVQLYEIDDFGDTNYQTKLWDVWVDGDTTEIEYSGSTDFKLGQVYALFINASDKVGSLTFSSPKEFRYGFIEPPEIINGDQTIDSMPIMLTWTALDINNLFRVIISEDREGNRVILEDEISNTSQYILEDKEHIQPGKTYYWHVELVVEDSGNTVKSGSRGSFIVEQKIDVISPVQDELIQDEEFITFFWEGSPRSQYVLKISYSKGMEQYKRYIVDGTTQTLSLKELGLKRDMIHYWTIRERDEFGNQWGKEPSPGSFILPKLDASAVFYPKNDIVYDDVTFSFSVLSWADYYRIDIYDRDKTVVYSNETDQGYLKLNLMEIIELKRGEKYSWSVTAISDEWNESIVSDFGKFRFEPMYKTNSIDNEKLAGFEELDKEKGGNLDKDLEKEKGANINKDVGNKKNNKEDLEKKTIYEIKLVDKPEFLTPAAVISWEPMNEKNITYELHLSHDVGFKDAKIIDLVEPRYAFKRVDEFKSDLFYKILVYDADERVMTQTKVYKISISDIDVLYEPILLVVPKDRLTKNSKKKFSWIPELKDAKLIISTKKNLNNSEEFLVSGDSIDFDEIKYNFKLGVTYYWTVVKQNHNSNMINSFTIVPGELSLIQPLRKIINNNKVIFQWVGDTNYSYKLILSKDKLFKKGVDEILTDELEIRYELKELGKFYWKIQQIDSDNHLIQETEVMWVELKEDRAAIDFNLRKNLEYFIKQNLDNDNKIRVEDWKLIKVESINKTNVSEDDINHLLDNKSDLIRITQ